MARKKNSSTTKAAADPAATGADPTEQAEATKWMYAVMLSYGLEVPWAPKGQAWAAIRILQGGGTVAQAAQVGLRGWSQVGASPKQLKLIEWKLPDVAAKRATSRRNAGLLLDAWFEPLKCLDKLLKAIDKADSSRELDGLAKDVKLLRGILPDDHWQQLADAGRERREMVGKYDGDEIPD